MEVKSNIFSQEEINYLLDNYFKNNKKVSPIFVAYMADTLKTKKSNIHLFFRNYRKQMRIKNNERIMKEQNKTSFCEKEIEILIKNYNKYNKKLSTIFVDYMSHILTTDKSNIYLFFENYEKKLMNDKEIQKSFCDKETQTYIY